MQKLITVSVDTKQLLHSAVTPFSINEVDSVNELLELGWQIEEWDILKEGEGDGEILLLVILNDDALADREDDFDDEFGFDEDDDLDDEEQDETEAEERIKYAGVNMGAVAADISLLYSRFILPGFIYLLLIVVTQ